MKTRNNLPGPVVIGGIGGSGTRVVAEILNLLGFYIGNDLNEPLDNLSYTLLFKRKNWYYRNRNRRRVIFRGLKIMEKKMLRSGMLTLPDYGYLLNACISMSVYGHNKAKDGSGLWPLERLKYLFGCTPVKTGTYRGWGWKEPNSHLLLRYMYDFFPGLKYIHTLRNGLDMAFSPNQQQLFNWGPMFGVRLPEHEKNIPEASFRYWKAANSGVIKTGNEIGGKHFYLLNFDQLCQSPRKEILNLLSFLELEAGEADLERISALPKIPRSTGRFRGRDTSWLTPEDRSFLNGFGFSVY